MCVCVSHRGAQERTHEEEEDAPAHGAQHGDEDLANEEGAQHVAGRVQGGPCRPGLQGLHRIDCQA